MPDLLFQQPQTQLSTLASRVSTSLDLCKDPEGWGPFTNVRVADFTPCFEDAVVTMLPNIFLLVAGGFRLWKLTDRSAFVAEITLGWHYYLKMIIVSLLFFVNTLYFVILVKDTTEWFDDIQFYATGINALATLLAIVLHHFEHTRSRLPSTLLLLYWLFTIVADGIKLRTLIDLGYPSSERTLFIIFTTSFALALAMFVLENVNKPKSEYTLIEDDPNECPEETANIFSRLTFHWMTPLMKLGYQKYLTMDDLWNLKQEDESKVISDSFQRHWQKEMQKSKPSLLRVLIVTFGKPFAFAAIFKALQDALQFTQPVLLRELMKWVNSYSTDVPDPAYRGVFIAVAMLVTALVQTVFLHQYFQLCFVTGMRIRAGLVTAIYRKALLLSNASRQRSTVGEVVNHMSVDAQRLMDLCTYLHIVWSGPFQIALALYFLYQTMGPSVWAGVAVLIFAIPINTYLAKKMRIYQKIQMGNKDTRIKLMNEVLNGIRVIKLYAWESAFLKRICHVRNDFELMMLRKIGVLSAIQGFTWASIPFLVSLSSFAVYVVISPEPLTSEVAFVAISLFNLLQFPLSVFPNVISSTVESSVSLYRIEAFLVAEELDPNAVKREDLETYASGTDANTNFGNLIEVNQGTFSWNKDSEMPILQDINLTVRKGQLMAIVGRVGAGKSSLISALLGDMVKINGDVIMRGKVAYVPQQAWIMNATMRDNITFGHRWDAKFYEETIKVCCLKPDIDMLPGGDLTEIGERGINLSGGQRARISLARAVYARADIYLLDDSLSAVDAHVGKHIFDDVIGPHGLLKNKARFFVTHGIAYLSKVDTIIMLREGKIILNGKFEELLSRKTELYTLMKDYGSQATLDGNEFNRLESTEIEEDLGTITPNEAEEIIELGIYQEAESLDVRNRLASISTLRKASLASLKRQRKDDFESGNEQLIQREESAKGSVDLEVYKVYFKSCSLSALALYVIFMIAAQGLQVGSNLFLKHWSGMNRDNGSKVNVWIFLGIYAAIGLGSSAFTVIQNIILWVFCAIRSAKNLHHDMLRGVFRSPMAFFDTTPLGRILNRFSKDISVVDDVLPRTFGAYFRTLMNVLATLIIISYATPAFLFFIVPMFFIYIGIQRYYLATSRELKRLDSVSRSPVYSNFQETISGVATIRAYDQEDRFIFENECRLDDNQRAYFPSISCNRWLAVRLEILGSLVIFSAASLAVIDVLTNRNIDAGTVGLSVSYALSVTQSLNWVIRQFCEIETNIVSVERIKEYIILPSEAPKIIEGNRPSHTWPDKGLIEFCEYSTRYRSGLELVLKGVSFKVSPKEKIGIVGRTGAGKSSLTLSLFRIIEAASGTIYVDGIDISSIGLYDLRSRLTIIPQDPVLFAGTVRENLDPFSTHDDLEIWQVLQNAHLKDHVARMNGKLNAVVLEGGENFSVGQRQLICLARALLRRTPILILDEATAAIDVETDSIIQETIRKEFGNCTILTIAHRINTVLDSDRIIVLDRGQIAEFDNPKTLLLNHDSLFYGLAKEAGLQ